MRRVSIYRAPARFRHRCQRSLADIYENRVLRGGAPDWPRPGSSSANQARTAQGWRSPLDREPIACLALALVRLEIAGQGPAPIQPPAPPPPPPPPPPRAAMRSPARQSSPPARRHRKGKPQGVLAAAASFSLFERYPLHPASSYVSTESPRRQPHSRAGWRPDRKSLGRQRGNQNTAPAQPGPRTSGPFHLLLVYPLAAQVDPEEGHRLRDDDGDDGDAQSRHCERGMRYVLYLYLYLSMQLSTHTGYGRSIFPRPTRSHPHRMRISDKGETAAARRGFSFFFFYSCCGTPLQTAPAPLLRSPPATCRWSRHDYDGEICIRWG